MAQRALVAFRLKDGRLEGQGHHWAAKHTRRPLMLHQTGLTTERPLARALAPLQQQPRGSAPTGLRLHLNLAFCSSHLVYSGKDHSVAPNASSLDENGQNMCKANRIQYCNQRRGEEGVTQDHNDVLCLERTGRDWMAVLHVLCIYRKSSSGQT